MILNEELFQKRNKQKTWLVYLIDGCEMGSEGWSGWSYYAVAHGDTDEEIYNDWLEQVKIIYGVDLSKDLEHSVGTYQNGESYDYWSCYYPLAKNELPTSVYGNSKELTIDKKYDEHPY